MFKKGKMEYRKFGNSGLEVSVISFGNWMRECSDFSENVAMIKACL